MKNKKCLTCTEECKQEAFIFLVKCPHYRKKGVKEEAKKTRCSESIDFTKRRKRTTQDLLQLNEKNTK